MKEKYCVHGFVQNGDKLKIIEPIKTEKLKKIWMGFEILFDGPSSRIELVVKENDIPVLMPKELKFRKVKLAHQEICEGNVVWVGFGKQNTNIWAKAHLATEACPDDWKSEVTV